MCIHIYLLCALSGGEKHVLTADVCKQRLFNVIEPFRYVCVFSLGEYGRVCVCRRRGGRNVHSANQKLRHFWEQEAQNDRLAGETIHYFLLI